jgi:hypothetical protein
VVVVVELVDDVVVNVGSVAPVAPTGEADPPSNIRATDAKRIAAVTRTAE